MLLESCALIRHVIIKEMPSTGLALWSQFSLLFVKLVSVVLSHHQSQDHCHCAHKAALGGTCHVWTVTVSETVSLLACLPHASVTQPDAGSTALPPCSPPSAPSSPSPRAKLGWEAARDPCHSPDPLLRCAQRPRPGDSSASELISSSPSPQEQAMPRYSAWRTVLQTSPNASPAPGCPGGPCVPPPGLGLLGKHPSSSPPCLVLPVSQILEVSQSY